MWQTGETSISLPNLSKRLAALIVSFSCCLGGIPIQKSKRFSRSSESSVTFVLTCVLVQIHKGHSITPTQTMHFFVAIFFQKTNIHLHGLNPPQLGKSNESLRTPVMQTLPLRSFVSPASATFLGQLRVVLGPLLPACRFPKIFRKKWWKTRMNQQILVDG